MAEDWVVALHSLLDAPEETTAPRDRAGRMKDVSKMYHERDTLTSIVTDKMVSLRLDAESANALDVLTEGGTSQSDAIRQALIVAARKRRSDELRAEADRLGADEADRKEMRKLMDFMESLREPV